MSNASVPRLGQSVRALIANAKIDLILLQSGRPLRFTATQLSYQSRERCSRCRLARIRQEERIAHIAFAIVIICHFPDKVFFDKNIKLYAPYFHEMNSSNSDTISPQAISVSHLDDEERNVPLIATYCCSKAT
ncbi:unnamed protein product [Albugo candida]|uniref:Uncharacterized protein n=1 Tax=Albugo candida TaxID=65357 RepID=A0A024GGX8_9STRA|nr:unnamed protein product [Albugo candida]|eukprot:CCI45920.1 unnamed protein product [Albugo candida]